MPFNYHILNKQQPYNVYSGTPINLLHHIDDYSHALPTAVQFVYDIHGGGVTFPNGTLRHISQFHHNYPTENIPDTIVLVGRGFVNVQVTAVINGDAAGDGISVNVA